MPIYSTSQNIHTDTFEYDMNGRSTGTMRRVSSAPVEMSNQRKRGAHDITAYAELRPRGSFAARSSLTMTKLGIVFEHLSAGEGEEDGVLDGEDMQQISRFASLARTQIDDRMLHQDSSKRRCQRRYSFVFGSARGGLKKSVTESASLSSLKRMNGSTMPRTKISSAPS